VAGSEVVVDKVRRGEVRLLDLSAAGGRLRKTRPVVIVQNDIGNRYSDETIVLAVRDRHGGRMLPIFVPVKKGVGGLGKDSIVDAGHINTVAQEMLGEKIGTLPETVLEAIDQALKISLALL
jgi:mRNA interferase MazF